MRQGPFHFQRDFSHVLRYIWSLKTSTKVFHDRKGNCSHRMHQSWGFKTSCGIPGLRDGVPREDGVSGVAVVGPPDFSVVKWLWLTVILTALTLQRHEKSHRWKRPLLPFLAWEENPPKFIPLFVLLLFVSFHCLSPSIVHYLSPAMICLLPQY